jgi:antirestriction factor ArdC-like protein
MSNTENTANEKRDVYERVTSQIVNAIEQGVSNWRMPWHTSGRFRILSDQHHEQETLLRHQYVVSVGCCSGEEVRPDRMGAYQQWQERKGKCARVRRLLPLCFRSSRTIPGESQDDGAGKR